MVLISVANIGPLRKHNMKISICADDIGQDLAITDAALQLFEQQRLNKISVLIQGPCARERINEISRARTKGLEVGLHFNLTLRFHDKDFCLPLNQLILLSQLRLLPTKKIHRQLEDQILRFEDTFQFQPDFMDGHQHVHQFPLIRDEVIELVNKRLRQNPKFWIRSTVLPSTNKIIPEKFKCNLLNILGGNRFLSMMTLHQIQHNRSFLGVYNFDAQNTNTYRALMLQWLSIAQTDSLIMCHPALTAIQDDVIGHQRPIEFAYLSSNQFLEDLTNFDCRLF